MKTFSVGQRLGLLAAILVTLMILAPATQAATTAKTISLTPLTVNAQTDMDKIQRGMGQMFHSRLSWRDKVIFLSPGKTTPQWDQLKDLKGGERIKAFAAKTGSDFVIVGSITELAGSYSIDLKVVDMAQQRYTSFFEYTKNPDELIDKIDRLAASINQKVFKRTTYTWEKMEAEKKADIDRLKRQNPEHLMRRPNPAQKEDSTLWQIWDSLF
ncbi:MAG: hypothetical protein MI747_19255 [Desulfobacterales bacterium]|nr:hypothetical protein [Desulfobacterales bacterium]